MAQRNESQGPASDGGTAAKWQKFLKDLEELVDKAHLALLIDRWDETARRALGQQPAPKDDAARFASMDGIHKQFETVRRCAEWTMKRAVHDPQSELFRVGKELADLTDVIEGHLPDISKTQMLKYKTLVRRLGILLPVAQANGKCTRKHEPDAADVATATTQRDTEKAFKDRFRFGEDCAYFDGQDLEITNDEQREILKRVVAKCGSIVPFKELDPYSLPKAASCNLRKNVSLLNEVLGGHEIKAKIENKRGRGYLIAELDPQ